MILKAENILGGCILTAAFAEAPDRADGIAVLSMAETQLFCAAIDVKLPFSKSDELALIWTNAESATVLIQASHCECPSISLQQLVKHLRRREGDTRWQLGEPTQ